MSLTAVSSSNLIDGIWYKIPVKSGDKIFAVEVLYFPEKKLLVDENGKVSIQDKPYSVAAYKIYQHQLATACKGGLFFAADVEEEQKYSEIALQTQRVPVENLASLIKENKEQKDLRQISDQEMHKQNEHIKKQALFVFRSVIPYVN